MPLHSGTVISWHDSSLADEAAAAAAAAAAEEEEDDDDEEEEEDAAAAATALEPSRGEQAGSRSGRTAMANR